MANTIFNFRINITNGGQLQTKCVRLSEIFAEAGEILGNINGGATIMRDAVNEVPEQDKHDFSRGTRFEHGGIKWIALDEIKGGVLAVAAECIKDEDGEINEMPFDKNNKNDWRKSSLRAFLNGEFLEYIGSDNLIKQTIDLIADDGMKDYGTSEDYVGILSCEQYRKYRDILPNYGCWWWTLTPWTCIALYSSFVRNVGTSGYVYNYGADYAYGVAPACIFKSDFYNTRRQAAQS